MAASAQLKIAPEIGATMYSHSNKTTILGQSATESTDLQPGLRAGAVLDLTLSDHFSLQPGVFYALNRTKSESSSTTGSYTYLNKNSVLLHAVQVPIYAVYKTGEEGSGRFFVGLGGYISYTIAGTQKSETATTAGGITTDKKSSLKMKLGNDKTDELRPLDYGPSAMLGYELANGLYFRGHFNYGLANMLPQGNSDAYTKSMSFGISVGYFFGSAGGYNGW
ncbi:outer membrane protein with beta-barrel domain [Taibaiella chishuiensis]|uniref:Outer membrane protein with beta-barrel domain n=2 Tax=Taibaiella chishuiensis TaxID=1434707 RepID=A0A2P8D4L6_9BACT|nr:outer membrane protein with beta-barrel domain [Taibaiella chishuiensis]